LRNCGFVFVNYRPRFVELTLSQHRMQQVPHFAVHAPDAVQPKPALDRNGHAGHKYKQDWVHEQPTLLEKRHH
jgi:hypothetical protein